MPRARRIQGEVAFPGDAVRAVAAKVTVELRDVSQQDQPSQLLATATFENVPVGPAHRLPFELSAPPADAGASLSMRVQVDMQPGQRHAAGDFLTTAAHPIAADGDVRGLVVPVTRL